MPFDGVAKPEINVEDLEAWLEKQPRACRYTYESCGSCLLAQYLLDRGHKAVWVTKRTYRSLSFTSQTLPGWADRVAALWPHTYGDALKRVKQLKETAHAF